MAVVIAGVVEAEIAGAETEDDTVAVAEDADADRHIVRIT